MSRLLIFFLCLVAGGAIASQEKASPASIEVLISVADQKLALLHDGGLVGKYRVSTSKFGLGDSFYSYKTPSGKLRVCEKIGGTLGPGTVIRHRSATGEVLKANAPGRDPIVTRILWLEGLENQNRNAKARGIYIHGTPEERTLGEPKSWGCIRMRSSDVMTLFSNVPVGTQVSIIPGHLPPLENYRPPEQPVQVAARTPPSVHAAKDKPSRATAAATPASQPTVASKKTASSAATSLATVSEPPDSNNRKVSNALKGSILMAGLPDAPTFESDPHAVRTAATTSSADAKTAAKP